MRGLSVLVTLAFAVIHSGDSRPVRDGWNTIDNFNGGSDEGFDDFSGWGASDGSDGSDGSEDDDNNSYYDYDDTFSDSDDSSDRSDAIYRDFLGKKALGRSKFGVLREMQDMGGRRTAKDGVRRQPPMKNGFDFSDDEYDLDEVKDSYPYGRGPFERQAEGRPYWDSPKDSMKNKYNILLFKMGELQEKMNEMENMLEIPPRYRT